MNLGQFASGSLDPQLADPLQKGLNRSGSSAGLLAYSVGGALTWIAILNPAYGHMGIANSILDKAAEADGLRTSRGTGTIVTLREFAAGL